MTVLGIDPGTISTGWAVVDEFGIIASGTLKGDKDTTPLQRSIAITDGILSVIETVKEKFNAAPDFIVIEDQYVKINAKSSLLLSKMVGMLVYALYSKLDVPIYLSAPSEIYKILPFTAKKFKNRKKYHKAVVEHVKETYNVELTSVDEAFAILLALSHIDTPEEVVTAKE